MKLLRSLKPNFLICIGVILVTFTIYNATKIDAPTPYNYFMLLSQSFLKGEVSLPDQPPHLNELVPSGVPGKWFVPYPPMPAIMAIPFVTFNILDNSQTFLSVIFGSISAGVCYLVIYKLYSQKRIALIVSALLAFGTSYWFLVTEGSSWYISHTFAVFFLLCSFLFIRLELSQESAKFTPQLLYWLISGLCVGAAYWSRLPTSVACLFFIVLPYSVSLGPIRSLTIHSIAQIIKQNYKYTLAFVVGFAIFLALNFSYNYIRYNTITDESYPRIPGLLQEPWFYDGFLSIEYIPKSFSMFAFKMPLPYDHFPYWKPSIEVLSYFLISPFMLLLPFAQWKNRTIVLFFLTGVAMLIPVFMHGGGGFTQFGYRYAMEATVLFLLTFSSVLRRKYRWMSSPFMISAVLVSIWGLYFIRVLHIYGW